MTQQRGLYTFEQLQKLLRPRTIAIVGASNRAGTIGNDVLVRQKGFSGEVYPINPKYDELEGFRAWPDLASLPVAPDCVILATPRVSTEDLVRQCAEIGAGGVVILSSGFAELGTEDAVAVQDRIAAISRESGLPVIGPNCIGYADFSRRILATFMPVNPYPEVTSRAIGVVSQSGALGFSLVSAAARGVSFSHVLACGNAVDVDTADLIGFLASDPACAVIVCIVEGVRSPGRMIEAARLARLADKPLILCKAGASREGAISALNHTGSDAGTLDAHFAALVAEGAVLVEQFERLVETASFFAKAPRQPSAEGLGFIATSGGAAILAADTAGRRGIAMPQPSEAVKTNLAQYVPDFVNIRNPCDITAQLGPNPGGFVQCVDALARDPGFGTMVAAQLNSGGSAATRLGLLAAYAGQSAKPVCLVWMCEDHASSILAELEPTPLIVFRSLDRCFAAIELWHARARAIGAISPAVSLNTRVSAS